MKFLPLLLLVFAFISTDPECNEELDSFPGVWRKGYYIDDLGCGFDSLKIGGQWHEYREGEILLAKHLFERDKDELFVAYVNEVFYHNNEMLARANDRFSASKYVFQAPTVKKDSNNVIVKGWVRRDGNMDPRDHFSLQPIIFKPDGSVSKGKVEKSFAYNLIEDKVEY